MVGGITPDDGTVTLPEIEMTKVYAPKDFGLNHIILECCRYLESRNLGLFMLLGYVKLSEVTGQIIGLHLD